MGSRGASSRTPAQARRRFERQLTNYIQDHDGQLPRTITFGGAEGRNMAMESIDKVYKITDEVEQFAFDRMYVQDGVLHAAPFGNHNVEGLSESAIDGYKKLIAQTTANAWKDPNSAYGMPEELRKRRR